MVWVHWAGSDSTRALCRHPSPKTPRGSETSGPNKNGQARTPNRQPPGGGGQGELRDLLRVGLGSRGGSVAQGDRGQLWEGAGGMSRGACPWLQGGNRVLLWGGALSQEHPQQSRERSPGQPK